MSDPERLIRDWGTIAPLHPWVIVELEPADGVTIQRIQTWPMERRGKGLADAALICLGWLGDVHGVALAAIPMPFTHWEEDRLRLCRWFARHGFVGDVRQPMDLWIRAPKR